MRNLDLDPEFLSRIFTYDESGMLRAKVKLKARSIGDVVCTKEQRSKSPSDLRLFVSLSGKVYRASRIVWVMHNNARIPEGMVIDHINGNSLDNRPENLRCVTQKMNTQNTTKPRPGSKTGILGVSLDEKSRKWIARIGVDGRCKQLGRFDSSEEAYEAYVQAKRRYHAGCTI